MKSYKEFITELFDRPVRLTYTQKDKRAKYVRWNATFDVDGQGYHVNTYPGGSAQDTQVIDFAWTTPMGMYGFGKTNLGSKSAGVVFATVMQFIQDLIDEVDPAVIKFEAEKSYDDNPESRIKLYTAMVKKYTPKEYNVKMTNMKNKMEFQLIRK
jgi:hypothetical protein